MRSQVVPTVALRGAVAVTVTGADPPAGTVTPVHTMVAAPTVHGVPPAEASTVTPEGLALSGTVTVAAASDGPWSATVTVVVDVFPAYRIIGVTVTEPPVLDRGWALTSGPEPVIVMVAADPAIGVLVALISPAAATQFGAAPGALAGRRTGSVTCTLPLPGTVTPEQITKAGSVVVQVPPPVTVGGVSSTYADGGFGILMVVPGAATSPVFVTVTTGEPDCPGARATGVVLAVPSLTMPEQVASAATTVPFATTPRPLSRSMSRARTVWSRRPVAGSQVAVRLLTVAVSTPGRPTARLTAGLRTLCPASLRLVTSTFVVMPVAVIWQDAASPSTARALLSRLRPATLPSAIPPPAAGAALAVAAPT
nr:hypothetical protein [Actinoplanes ferrugineus]